MQAEVTASVYSSNISCIRSSAVAVGTTMPCVLIMLLLCVVSLTPCDRALLYTALHQLWQRFHDCFNWGLHRMDVWCFAGAGVSAAVPPPA